MCSKKQSAVTSVDPGSDAVERLGTTAQGGHTTNPALNLCPGDHMNKSSSY